MAVSIEKTKQSKHNKKWPLVLRRKCCQTAHISAEFIE